LIRLVLVADL